MMDLVEAGARNMAAWHHWQLRARGLDCRYSDSVWTCQEAAPGIFLAAITLAPVSNESNPDVLEEIEQWVSLRGEDNLILCDWWMSLDLSHLGFEPEEPELLLARPPGDLPEVSIPSELEIEHVTDPNALAEFERASFEGFEGPGTYELNRWHADATLGDPNMKYLMGRVDGQVVSVSIGCVSDGVVGVYGVATPPQFRRRGYGAAMTWAALQAAPDLPAVLQPSDIAESMYRKLGFDDIGRFRHWRRPRDSE